MIENKLGILETRVILLGFKGSGKSTIGKIVADKIGFKFADIDDIIESKYEADTKNKKNVREIYKEHGADFFAKLEADAITHSANLKESVISLGGRTPLNTMFDETGFPLTVFVYLKADLETLFGRIESIGFPPFIDKKNPKESINNLLNERKPYYEKLADISIDSSNETAEEIAESVINAIRNREVGSGR